MDMNGRILSIEVQYVHLRRYLLLKESFVRGKMVLCFGALAHLVERNNGIVEVNGSNPLRSIGLMFEYASDQLRCL